jgi:hypothetical protein
VEVDAIASTGGSCRIKARDALRAPAQGFHRRRLTDQKSRTEPVTKLTAWAMAVPPVLLSIGTAHADSNDDDFVEKANNNGVVGAPADLIRVAHQVCGGLDDGNSPDAIADALVSQLGLRSDRLAIFESFSATHYCPKYSNLQFKNPH